MIRTDPWVPGELVPAWKRWAISGLRNTANAFVVSLSAWLGSLPLIAVYFHLVTPVSLAANLVMVPLSGAALTCGLGSLLCGAWAGWVSELFNHSAWFWMRLMMLISEKASLLPGAYFRVPTPHFGLVCAYYLALVAAGVQGLHARRWRTGLVVVALMLFAVFCVGAWSRRGEVTVTILPMRGGHAVLVDGPGRANDLLIDCGDEQSAAFVVKAYLESRGFSRLPWMVLTHGDVRHVGGASLIAEEFQVATVCTGQNRSRSPSYRQMLAQLAQEPKRWRQLCSGDTVAGLRVIHPARGESFAMADDNAIVLDGELGGVRLLLLSDLGPEGQAALIERGGPGRGGIVVTGLPSRGEPLSESLIEAVNPELVIVADSDWPAYERAGEAVRKRLGKSGVPVLYCSDVGTVTLRLKAGHWQFSTMNPRKPSDALPQEASSSDESDVD
jgi:competence protein ComEC